MIIVSPSLLACNFLQLENELNAFDNIDNLWFHLDIMDGHFVPNLTFGHPIAKQICQISKHKVDAHFMVTNPEFYIDTFSKFPIHNITFHFEASDREEEVIRLIEKAKNLFTSVGISLRPKTAISALSDTILNKIDLLLMMSVEPGFGGQAFMPQTYQRLDELSARKNRLNAKFCIQVDGGVDDSNAKELIQHGANNLVAGTYIFKVARDQYRKQIESLRKN